MFTDDGSMTSHRDRRGWWTQGNFGHVIGWRVLPEPEEKDRQGRSPIGLGGGFPGTRAEAKKLAITTMNPPYRHPLVQNSGTPSLAFSPKSARRQGPTRPNICTSQVNPTSIVGHGTHRRSIFRLFLSLSSTQRCGAAACWPESPRHATPSPIG